MRAGEHVRLKAHPSRVGFIYKVMGEHAFVLWNRRDGGQYKLAELAPEDDDYEDGDLEAEYGPSSSVAIVHAPEIADLQYATRLDPETDSVYVQRADDYRGRSEPLPAVESAEDIYEMFRYMDELDREHIVCGLLNVRNELTGWKVVHVGELAAVEASGRQIVRDALLGNAAGMFVLHNHPTGDPMPSDADKDLTKFLAKMADDWDIVFFDHVIIGCEADHHAPYYSFREDGQLT